VAKQSNPPRPPLWQPIRIEQTEAAACFAIEVGADDINLGLFIADGHCDVSKCAMHRGMRKAMRVYALLRSGLEAELSLALLDMGAFAHVPKDGSVRVYCHRAVIHPDGQKLGLLCSLSPLLADEQHLPADRLAAVSQAAAQHRADMTAHAADAAMRKEQDARLLAQMSPDRAAEFKDITDKFSTRPPPPLFDLKPLVASFPPGLVIKLSSTDPDSVERTAQRAVTQNPDDRNPPPRDGWYEIVIASRNPKQRHALVTWTPHRGLPAYPEIRAAAARRLPRAFLSPRLSTVHPPEIDGGALSVVPQDLPSMLFDPSNMDWLDDEDFGFSFDFPKDVAREAKGRLQKLGFECAGWYQPHHFYSEETWGIYIDAPSLDKTACSIAEDLRTGGMRRCSDALAAKLALMLVYQHELFHAKVEAALTWLELQALQPKFRRYKAKVNDALKGTDEHLEEALANFSAWAWLNADAVVAQFTRQLSSKERLVVERVVRYHLDLSPPGYRRWSDGHQTATWRTLTTQMAQGAPKLPSPGHGLPIESMLQEPLPFDYRPWDDVPCRFVGSGRIASSMFAAPATLNLPQRQEVRKVIQRHFRYELIRGAGKGSHEKFKHADGRMFPLPQRDPISMTVFKKFLDHFALRKHDYDQIRQTV
jgi:hypothetical protein